MNARVRREWRTCSGHDAGNDLRRSKRDHFAERPGGSRYGSVGSRRDQGVKADSPAEDAEDHVEQTSRCR